VMGSEDHMFLPPVKKMVAGFSKSELAVVENCGHVCNVEEPKKFNEIAIKFLQEQSESVPVST